MRPGGASPTVVADDADADATGPSASPRLTVAGNVCVDLLLGPLAPWPTPGTETLVDHAQWRVGGALGNTALALAQLVVPARLVWDVGDDMLGRWLRERMRPAGDAPRTLDAATALTVAHTHPDGERTFVSHLGHLDASDPSALERAIERAGTGDVVFVGGSFLLPRWRPALPALFERARRRGVRTALDTGWPTEGWSDAVRRELLATLAHVDLFLPNLDEARGLVGRGDADAAEVLDVLTAVVPGTSVVKLGADGAACILDGEPVAMPAPAVRVLDTVGAGDTFNALLLAAVAEGVSLRAALAGAVEATARALATSPRSLPRWSELRARLADAPNAVGGDLAAAR